MKRGISILLVLCLCIGITACGQSAEATDDSIQIDKTTIYSLLNIKISSVEESPDLRTTFHIFPVKGGTFSNAKLTLKLVLNDGYHVKSLPGEEYKVDESGSWDQVTIDIVLPADGYYTFDGVFDYFYCTEDPIKGWSFENMSGTFVPA